MKLTTVQVPDAVAPVFERAEALVEDYFRERKFDPEHGSIVIRGERYVLIRARALSVDLFGLVRNLYGVGQEDEADAFSRSLLYDLAFALGRSDAKTFTAQMGVTDPLERLSAGPVRFAHTGWASVHIDPVSNPEPGDAYCLVYEHPYSFEAESWGEPGAEERTRRVVCVMNAGYSAGWCSEAFGMKLVAVELTCRACGAESCRFVMAPPEQIERRVREHAPEGQGDVLRDLHEAPDVFARGRLHDELARARAELEARVEARTRELQETNARLEAEARQRRRMQSSLLQSAKLEAVGRLARGVAHDFNNLLTVIQGHAEVLAMDLEEGADAIEDVEAIRLACRRAAELTGQLLAFSRGAVTTPEPVQLREVVAGSRSLMERLMGARIQVRLDRCGPDARVLSGRGVIGQVILNLALNSKAAMPRGGTLRLVSGQVTVASDEVQGLRAGEYAVFRVEDDGVGMTPEVLRRACEPFFTTRQEGEGAGLGLSVVHGLVDDLQGHLHINSQLDRGTIVSVYLPLATSEGRVVQQESLRARGETLLVVEDRDEVRQLVDRALATYGYDVVVAENGPAAIELAHARDEPVDLVITDVVMPYMNGRQLAERLRELWPDTPVLYMSGFTDDVLLREGVEQQRVDFLPKPFRVMDALRRVREILDRPR